MHHTRPAGYRQALSNLAQAPRWRGLIIGTASLLLVLWIWQANSDPNAPGSNLYNKLSGRPQQQHQDFIRPNKDISQLHLLIHAPKINSNVCRSLLSSFILGYPSPTLVGYRASPSNETVADDFWLDFGLTDTASYMNQQDRIADQDTVVIADGENTLFQLPPEALLSEYNVQMKKSNAELHSQYRDIPVKTLSGKQKLQRFNQTVVFAAEYGLFLRPHSGFLSRFRLPERIPTTHLNDKLAIGSGSSIRRLYTAAAEQNTRIERTDRDTFNTMFAQQSLLRKFMAKEQREFKAWLHRNVLPSDPNFQKKLAEDYAAAKKDLGIGLDYKTAMFQTIPATAQHVSETVIVLNDYSSFPKPDVFEKLALPFTLQTSSPHLNTTNKAIPGQKQQLGTLPYASTWSDISLFTNPKTQRIPSLISMLSPKNRTSSSTSGILTAPDANMRKLWQSMWFYPHARTLLQQYVAVRGNHGGVWTVDGKWLDVGGLCAPFGNEIFEDGKKGWVQVK
jgi:hypothetical protein